MPAPKLPLTSPLLALPVVVTTTIATLNGAAAPVCVCVCVCVLVSQLCPILCDPMDGSLPGSSVHGISQARILELVATALSAASLITNNITMTALTEPQR